MTYWYKLSDLYECFIYWQRWLKRSLWYLRIFITWFLEQALRGGHWWGFTCTCYTFLICKLISLVRATPNLIKLNQLTSTSSSLFLPLLKPITTSTSDPLTMQAITLSLPCNTQATEDHIRRVIRKSHETHKFLYLAALTYKLLWFLASFMSRGRIVASLTAWYHLLCSYSWLNVPKKFPTDCLYLIYTYNTSYLL